MTSIPRRSLSLAFSVALALVALASGALADTATLKPRAMLRADAAELRLGDVATLDGAYAETFADAVVTPDVKRALAAAGGALRVDLSSVRSALERRRVNWGRLALQGSVCVVRLEAPPEPKAPEPLRSAREPATVDLSGVPTVRTLVAERLSAALGVQPADLRIAFDPDQDDLLDTPITIPGRRAEAQPLAAGSSARMPVQVRIYDGERMTASGTVTADTLIRRRAVIVAAPVRKGETISSQHLREEEQWLAPGAGAGVDEMSDVLGGVARSRLEPGTTLREDSVLKPVVVRRGDMVTVHALSGTVSVKAPARALSDGREGEVIEFRMEKSKKTFYARVDGKGRAVMQVGADRDTATPLASAAGEGDTR